MNQQLVDRQSFSNWVTGSLTKVTCVTGFHFRNNVGIHILNSVSDHVQLVILIPHAIHVDDDVDEEIMDGHRGKNNAVSYHLLTLVDDGGWAIANFWADSCKQLVFNETEFILKNYLTEQCIIVGDIQSCSVQAKLVACKISK